MKEKSHSEGKPSRFKKGKFRRNWFDLFMTVAVILVTVAVVWVIWGEMDSWYSTTHVENMVGQVWKISSAGNVLEIDVSFTETSTVFAYEGTLPGYVTEGQYVRALFQFSPDNDRIVEFLGPTNPPGISLPLPLMLLLVVLAIASLAGVIIWLLGRSEK